MEPSVRFDSTTNAYRATFSCSDLKPSTAVVLAVAEIRDADPSELDPLYDVVDPEALDRLFTNTSSPVGATQFEYEGFEISIHKGGELHITPRKAAVSAV